MSELKKNGTIRKIGVSIYDNQQLKRVMDIPDVDVIQLPFNLLDNANKRGALLIEARRRGKIIQARSVFLQGLFFKNIDQFPAKLRPLRAYVEKLQEVAKENGISMEKMASLMCPSLH